MNSDLLLVIAIAMAIGAALIALLNAGRLL
jgi:hypothetical protein